MAGFSNFIVLGTSQIFSKIFSKFLLLGSFPNITEVLQISRIFSEVLGTCVKGSEFSKSSLSLTDVFGTSLKFSKILEIAQGTEEGTLYVEVLKCSWNF